MPLWLVILLDCLGYSMAIFGTYGVVTEGMTTLLNSEKRGTFDPVRLATYSLFLGTGIGLIVN